jgi:dTDP-4-dehydrorhamnose reductase
MSDPIRVLVLGGRGQVGGALAALEWPGAHLAIAGHEDGDITAPRIAAVIAAARPRVVINAAAYTNVEGAERDPAAAFAVNALAPATLAAACAQAGAWLIHYSTDYVFDGSKDAPYIEGDAPGPLNVYGQSKLAGEQAVLASGCRHLVLRTGWVYDGGGDNFIGKVLARARAGAPLRVVDDQFGAPTWAHALALATRHAVGVITAPAHPSHVGSEAEPASLAAPLDGIYHLTAAGSASWHEVALRALALRGIAVPVAPVASASFTGAARRPRNSQLDSGCFAAAFGYRIGPWQEDLERCLVG